MNPSSQSSELSISKQRYRIYLGVVLGGILAAFGASLTSSVIDSFEKVCRASSYCEDNSSEACLNLVLANVVLVLPLTTLLVLLILGFFMNRHFRISSIFASIGYISGPFVLINAVGTGNHIDESALQAIPLSCGAGYSVGLLIAVWQEWQEKSDNSTPN